jgi:polysaccharide pyruvyl transferase WcaK-like protein
MSAHTIDTDTTNTGTDTTNTSTGAQRSAEGIMISKAKTDYGASAENIPATAEKSAVNATNRETVLIIGNYGNYNMGDEALLKSLALSILEENKDAQIVVPTRHPEFVQQYHSDLGESIRGVPLFDYKSLVKGTFRADRIIVGGGGIWSGYTGKAAKALPIYIMGSRMLGKRVQVRGIGVYKTAPKAERMLVNLSFLTVKEINVRDVESYGNIWNIIKRRGGVTLTSDLATFLPELVSHSGRLEQYEQETAAAFGEIIARCDRKHVVGISIKPLKDAALNEQLIAEFAEYINAMSKGWQDIMFILFPFANTESPVENDSAMLDELCGRLDSTENIVRMQHTNPILWYLFMRNNVDLFIGMRFHAVIFSHIAGVPFLAIPYENKVAEYIRDIQHQEVIAPAAVTGEQLIAFTRQRLATWDD